MNDHCSTSEIADFSDLLEYLFRNQEKAALLIDDHGWGRAEGIIKKLDLHAAGGSITLDNGAPVDVLKIIAVNGVFKQGNTC